MTVEVLSFGGRNLVFLAFESSREVAKERSEDEVLHGDGVKQFLEQAPPLTCETNGLATQETANWY
jgi:hypothetical protein